MTLTSRIEDLRRRVDRDPASIAFAQLAEEHRRNGDHDEAVRVARAGLVHRPGYLSARVTLGCALLQLGQVDDARVELESVLEAAPDNLAAVRALTEIHTRGPASPKTPVVPAVLSPALPGDHHLDAGASFSDAVVDGPPADRAAVDETAAGLGQLGQFAAEDSRAARATAASATVPEKGAVATLTVDDAAVAALERWLAAIAADRAIRS